MATARNPRRLPSLLLFVAWLLSDGGNAEIARPTSPSGISGASLSSSSAETDAATTTNAKRSGIRRGLEKNNSNNNDGGGDVIDLEELFGPGLEDLFGPDTSTSTTTKEEIFNASSLKENLFINNFISRSGVATCQQNLFAADSNSDGTLDRDEYAEFVRLESGGEIDRSFGSSGAVFVALYYVVACNQCYDDTDDDQCCVGDDAVIVLPQEGDGQKDAGQWVLFLCSSVEEAIEDEIGERPTPSPTRRPNNDEEPTPEPAAGLPTATEVPSGAPASSPSREPTPHSDPTDAPQQPEPTAAATGTPSPEPTKRTRSPAASPPTRKPVDDPTSEPSGPPTSPPAESPSESPPASTEAPSSGPTASPQAGPTPAPIAATTESPSLEPSDAPVTEAPSDVPATDAPTDVPAADAPSDAPATSTPSEAPVPATEAPSGVPTESPVASDTGVPTLAPNADLTTSPAGAPTDTSSNDTLCVQFFYSLKNTAGLSADDVMDEVNNTLKTGLELATRNVTIQILNSTFPASTTSGASRALEAVRCSRKPSSYDADFSSVTTASLLRGHDVIYNGLSFAFGDDEAASILDSLGHALYARREVDSTRSGRSRLFVSAAPGSSDRWRRGRARRLRSRTRSHQQDRTRRQNQRSRRLVYYTDVLPPTVTDVVDDSFCTGTGTGQGDGGDGDSGVRCAFVSTEVCVVLEDGDDPDAIEKAIDDGFRVAILDGSFFDAIPPENVP